VSAQALLLFPFVEARAVLEGCIDNHGDCAEELDGPARAGWRPLMAFRWPWFVPTWCGLLAQGEARLAPFLGLGTLVTSTLAATALWHLARNIRSVSSRPETNAYSWRRAGFQTLDNKSNRRISFARWATAASPGCAIITHEFRGGQPRVLPGGGATAFGLRRDHVLVEILASFADRSEPP